MQWALYVDGRAPRARFLTSLTSDMQHLGGNDDVTTHDASHGDRETTQLAGGAGSARPLLLPVTHDALTARLIRLAGFPAYQIGGFALVGARFAHPDIDLTQYGEQAPVVRDIIAASDLPVLVDEDDGYGDVKNVTYTVQGYEAMGALEQGGRALNEAKLATSIRSGLRCNAS